MFDCRAVLSSFRQLNFFYCRLGAVVAVAVVADVVVVDIVVVVAVAVIHVSRPSATNSFDTLCGLRLSHAGVVQFSKLKTCFGPACCLC